MAAVFENEAMVRFLWQDIVADIVKDRMEWEAEQLRRVEMPKHTPGHRLANKQARKPKPKQKRRRTAGSRSVRK